VRLASYYSVFGVELQPPDGNVTHFDSAIVNPYWRKMDDSDDEPTNLNAVNKRAVGPVQRVFRPVYCVLAERTTSVCDEDSGE
jgi:hypothetical protein